MDDRKEEGSEGGREGRMEELIYSQQLYETSSIYYYTTFRWGNWNDIKLPKVTQPVSSRTTIWTQAAEFKSFFSTILRKINKQKPR